MRREVDAAAVMATIDRSRFDAIRARHPHERTAWATKYLDLDEWIPANIARARRLGLDRSPPLRILDIGCGCGYFVHACRLMGHEAIGLDVPGNPLYRDVTELLGVRVVEHRIEPFAPLPALGHFGLVTAFMVTFNGHGRNPWGAEQWRYFVNSLDADRIYLELNREADGTLVAPIEGARIDEHRVLIGRC